jgi:hypothetical protein
VRLDDVGVGIDGAVCDPEIHAHDRV